MAEKKLVVHRGFGLTDHLLALDYQESCYIPVDQYSPNVLYVTLSKLRKRGINFTTHRIKPKGKPLQEIKVTRLY